MRIKTLQINYPNCPEEIERQVNKELEFIETKLAGKIIGVNVTERYLDGVIVGYFVIITWKTIPWYEMPNE